MLRQAILLTVLLLSGPSPCRRNIGTRQSHRRRHDQNKKRTHTTAWNRRTGVAAAMQHRDRRTLSMWYFSS